VDFEKKRLTLAPVSVDQELLIAGNNAGTILVIVSNPPQALYVTNDNNLCIFMYGDLFSITKQV
jgi:hypothetical protein